MKEITEDYCDFETAKLLKEKGFNEKCFRTYFNDGIISRIFDDKDEIYNENLLPSVVDAPTLQMAVKWLREVHGIHINVFRYPAAFLDDNNKQHKPWWFQYTLLKPINEIDIDSHMTDEEFESAEEAMDYAIKYCLENLI